MKFKPLEVEPEPRGFKRIIRSQHIRKSIIYTVIGAIAGFLYFYLTKGKHMDVITTGDILKNMFIGGFLGFFITNSPCARNKC